jgi:hypothetical protein
VREGIPHAINTGDALFTISRVATHRLSALGFSDAKVIRMMKIYDETCLRLCEGQFIDIAASQKNEMQSVEHYFEMIGRKTAALISGGVESAAVLATDSGVLNMMRSTRTFMYEYCALVSSGPQPCISRYSRSSRFRRSTYASIATAAAIWSVSSWLFIVVSFLPASCWRFRSLLLTHTSSDILSRSQHYWAQLCELWCNILLSAHRQTTRFIP